MHFIHLQKRYNLFWFWLDISIIFLCIITAPSAHAATIQGHYFAHDAVQDRYGVIAPWYTSLNGQFDFRVRIAAETMKRYPWTDSRTEVVSVPAYMVNGCWQITADGRISVAPMETADGGQWSHWANGDYGQRVYFVLSGLVDYYRYTGDPAAIAHITMQANHLLDYTLTSQDHPWPRFPISVPVKGQGYHYYDPNGFIQLDIAASQGLALLKAYQLVGDNRWLDAAKHWGDVFAEHLHKNSEPQEAPWGRYANPNDIRWKEVAGMNRLTGGTAMILEFFEELVRLGCNGSDNQIIQTRDACRVYIRDYLLPAWLENETWGRHFWDWPAPVQTIITTDAALRCFMAKPDYFPNWRNDVRNIMTLYLNHTCVNPDSGGDVYSGAWAYPESYSCCVRSLDYAPMEMAAAYAQYGVLADSQWSREMARRQIILTTYHAHDSGVVEDKIDGGAFVAGDWFKIAHPMVLKHTLDTMAWLPDILGANRENHIMRSSSVVKSVIYGKGRIEYSTFDAPANTVDVLRLAFAPRSITADGKHLRLNKNLDKNGYTIRKLPNGDCVVSIRHDGKTSIVVEGKDPQIASNDTDLKYTGKWNILSNPKDFSGKVHVTDSNTAAVICFFKGNQVRLIGLANPAGGMADVYLDNARQLVGIDYWNPKELHQQVLYYKNGLSNDEHELKIVARGAKNPLSSGCNIYIDAIQYSAAKGTNGFGEGGGLTGFQRMIFGYPKRVPYIDSAGSEWLPATEFVVRTGNSTDSVAETWWTQPNTKSIGNTSDPELYRYGVHASQFWVNITVGPGKYYIKLKFAERREISQDVLKQMVTIHINGNTIITNMNIAAAAGAINKALDLVFYDISPKNGVIEIRLSNQHGGEAILQAMEVGPNPASLQ